jgi:hypothetical protein
LLTATQGRFVEFNADTSGNAVSHGADFTFRASATSVPELRDALHWVRRVLGSSYVDLANVDRLRDIIAQRLAADESYTRRPEQTWVHTPALAFRYQSDVLYLALESEFAKAHWDGRLYWLLHEPVSGDAIDSLGQFATRTLAAVKSPSRFDLARQLSALGAKGLEAELVNHWRRNLNSFPEDRLIDGLHALALEVQEDLRVGPAQAVIELRELQQLVIDRGALRLDLLISPAALDSIEPDLTKFVESIPHHSLSQPAKVVPVGAPISAHLIIDKLVRENGLSERQFPWCIGVVIPDELSGNTAFYSDFVNYSQTDRNSLLRYLSSGLLAGRGPGSAFMKSRQAGLSYNFSMRADPSRRVLIYYADRSLDIPSLLSSMNSAADGVPNNRDPYQVDYALRQAFSIPRSLFTFSFRERALTQDIRDGNTPEKVRRFYEALLKLRQDPNLLSEITHLGRESLCGILLEEQCRAQQQADHSIFFFVGSEKTLSDIEERLPIPKLVRIWPSDYWLP